MHTPVYAVWLIAMEMHNTWASNNWNLVYALWQEVPKRVYTFKTLQPVCMDREKMRKVPGQLHVVKHSMFTVFLFLQRKRAINRRRMCWSGHSMAIMSDHRPTAKAQPRGDSNFIPGVGSKPCISRTTETQRNVAHKRPWIYVRGLKNWYYGHILLKGKLFINEAFHLRVHLSKTIQYSITTQFISSWASLWVACCETTSL